LKKAYRSLPFSQRARSWFKDAFFIVFHPFLKNSPVFRNWRLYKYLEMGKGYVGEANLDLLTNPHAFEFRDRLLKQIHAQPKDFGDFVPFQKHDLEFCEEDIRLIAYYLPQYHAIPENDAWWGRGFTEWANVTKATPQFIGHYQPQLPVDVGFYDLFNINTLKRQAELAKNYGVFGFCFHYYWFAGKRLLEMPLETWLGNPGELEMPFCVCWANENWTRRWDGLEDEILIAQEHSDADDLACIQDIARYFRDGRYIRVGGKPLVIVYNAGILPDAARTVEIWKDYCRSSGIGEILAVAATTFGLSDPAAHGFDFGVEFPPHVPEGTVPEITRQYEYVDPHCAYRVYDMASYVDSLRTDVDADAGTIPQDGANIFKTVFPGWDNSPRRSTGASVFHTQPSVYADWLRYAMDYTKSNLPPEMQLVFVNAWNEWGEGAHLEPDMRYGYAYLEATAQTVEAIGTEGHTEENARDIIETDKETGNEAGNDNSPCGI